MSKREGPSLGLNAEAMASAMPPLVVAAERVAATVLHGVHGRRRVGQGESFWQFRRYGAGDAATRLQQTYVYGPNPRHRRFSDDYSALIVGRFVGEYSKC